MYRLRCFGRLALETERGDARELRSQKHSALLLYLLAHRGRTFPRARLASLFWDTKPRLARHSLSQALYDIRTTLTGVEFDTNPGRVGAGAGRVRYDGEEFEEALRADEVRRAVQLYGGRFAPDAEDVGNSDYVRWIESERQRYRRLAEMALYRHVRASDDRGEWGEMCVSAMRLLEMNPLSEETHRALMRGLWLQGDQAAAVRHFEEVKEFLAGELPAGLSQETVDLAERIRSSRPTESGSASEQPQRVDMVGRKAEFEALKRALERLSDRRRGILVRVHGEAGIGKTRLLEEFRGLAELDRARVLESRCYAAEADVPYEPVADGLRELAEEAAAATEDDRTYYQLGHLFPEAFDRPGASEEAFAEPDAGRRRLYEESADLLRREAEKAPLVWLVEDAHWIDASSASLLHYAARRLADHAFLLVITSRSDEESRGAARELLEGEPASVPEVVDMEVGPLDRDETARLVESVLGADPARGVVDSIHDLAGGNPFYALEILRSSSLAGHRDGTLEFGNGSGALLTTGLKALLKRRLRGLAPGTLRILETVAVAGRHATAPLIGAVTDLAADELAELGKPLYGRRLLCDVESRIEFSHDITRDFVYAEMGELHRSALHLAVGEELAKRQRTVDSATLARHFEEGGDRARAYEFALEAAKDAERRHGHEEAIQMAELAVSLGANDSDRGSALWELAKIQVEAALFDEACQAISVLKKILPVDPIDPAKVDLLAARAHIQLSRWEEARAHLASAHTRIAQNDPVATEALVECLHLRLKAALHSNDHASALRLKNLISDITADISPSLLTPDAKALIASSLSAYDLFSRSTEKALTRLQELAEIRDLSWDVRMIVTLMKGLIHHRIAEWDSAVAAFRRYGELAKTRSDLTARLIAINNLLCVYIDRGLWSKAEDLVQSYQELGYLREIESNHSRYLRENIAELKFSRGDYEAARQEFEAVALAWGQKTNHFVPTVLASLGLCCLATGRIGEARRLNDELRVRDWGDLAALPARDSTVWFNGFMMWDEDPVSAAEFMGRVGEKDLDIHLVSGLRILWLRELFQVWKSEGLGGGEKQTRVLLQSRLASRLRRVESGWFLRSSRRWMETVSDRMKVRY